MPISNDLNDREHAKFRDINGDPVVAVTTIDGSLPTTGNNPSLVLGYTGDNLTTIDKTIDGTTYRKTLTYSGSTLTEVSSWVEV